MAPESCRNFFYMDVRPLLCLLSKAEHRRDVDEATLQAAMLLAHSSAASPQDLPLALLDLLEGCVHGQDLPPSGMQLELDPGDCRNEHAGTRLRCHEATQLL